MLPATCTSILQHCIAILQYCNIASQYCNIARKRTSGLALSLYSQEANWLSQKEMYAYCIKADFHSVQNVARSTFSERFLLNYKHGQAEQISAAVDFTHFKRKRSLKIDRATFCTEWKSALQRTLRGGWTSN